jgi:hypothetical protein
MTGAAFVGGELILQTGCKSEKTIKALSLFNNEQITLLDEIGDIIIPTTDTPGAKAAQIGSFINKIATDCYSKNEQDILVKGIEKMKLDFEKKYSTSFVEAPINQRNEFLNAVNLEMKQYTQNKKYEDPEHYFLMLKQLTILGYFTSEIGASKTLNYIPVPTKYDGNYPYKVGDKAWATS